MHDIFDLRPAAIIERLDLRRPIYRNTAAYGHFGRSDKRLHVGAHRPRGRAQEGGGGDRLTPAARVVRVQPDVPAIHRAFDYLSAARAGALPVGTVVRVPLHGRRVRGWVLDPDVAAPEAPRERLREVLAVVSAGPPADVVDLCRWAAWRWAGPLATFLRAASPPNVVRFDSAPELEAAVYPGPAMSGAELHLVAPRDDRCAAARARGLDAGDRSVGGPGRAQRGRMARRGTRGGHPRLRTCRRGAHRALAARRARGRAS